jgi:hypothetical protein
VLQLAHLRSHLAVDEVPHDVDDGLLFGVQHAATL